MLWTVLNRGEASGRLLPSSIFPVGLDLVGLAKTPIQFHDFIPCTHPGHSCQHNPLLWRPNGTSSKNRSSNVRSCISVLLYLG